MNTIDIPAETARPVHIPLQDAALYGDLQIPEDPIGLVIFIHGSGSSRLSPRNRLVAKTLNNCRFATLLLDLLTTEEQRVDAETMQFRFDIPLLAARCALVTNWAQNNPDLHRLPIGLFGASTGSAAALITAATAGVNISAVVSRGGRPDLATDALPKVKAPTLLIVGGDDGHVLQLNIKAMDKLECPARLHVVPGATHLFEEKGALEEVARTASEWFAQHVTVNKHRAAS